MRNQSQQKKFLQMQFCLLMWGLFIISRAALSQDTGYWDSRFGGDYWTLYDGVYAIAVANDEIYVGGAFSGVKKWNGSSWSSLGGTNDRIVQALAVVGDDLYVGGGFTAIDTIPANYIAKLNLVTKKWSSLLSGNNNGVNGRVTAFAVHGNQLYLGGSFTKAGGVNANGIAVWNTQTKTWKALGEGVKEKGYVNAIAVSKGEVYAGGYFTSAGDGPANNIAKWDGKKWSALGNGVNDWVKGMAILGNELYVGGSFTQAGDINVNSGAKWNTVTGQWSNVGNGFLGSPVSNGKAIYGSGCFGTPCVGIAKWNPDSNSWSPLGSGVSGQVLAILAKGNKVYVGGSFRYAGGKPSTRFAIWHEPQASPVLSPLPELRFNEDRILFHPIRDWHPFVADNDDPDSTLKFTVLSGKQVKATRHPRRYAFSAPANWFGRDTLQVIVTDPSQLADTTALMITIDPTNDKPKWTGLPDSLSFKTSASAQLKMWDLVEDLETPDSLLLYRFSASKPGLRWKFHRATGMLVLTAPQFHGKAHLFVKAGDGKAAAYDTIVVRVEMPEDILAKTTGQNSSKQIPTEFVLQQNYPNPFNPTTLIRFGLPQDAEVKLEIFNLAGQHVATLLNAHKAAGYHEVLFEAAHLPSGNYFTVLRADEAKLVRRIVLMK